jgi:hypothetical protein
LWKVIRERKKALADDSCPLTWVQRQHAARMIVGSVQSGGAASVGTPILSSDPQVDL